MLQTSLDGKTVVEWRAMLEHPLSDLAPYSLVKLRGFRNNLPLYFVAAPRAPDVLTGGLLALKSAARACPSLRCAYCSVIIRHHGREQDVLKRGATRNTVYGVAPFPTVDHVLSRRDGGRDVLHNLLIACPDCNADKGDRPALSFVAGMRGQRHVERVMEALAARLRSTARWP